MRKLKLLFLCLSFAFFSSSIVAQDQEVNIAIDTLSNNIYMLTGQGGNIGIYVGQDHAFMIDDQFGHLSDKLKTAISKLTDKPIAFLFNTHMHGDHTGGNANFNTPTTTIVAHDNVRKTMAAKSVEDPKFDIKMLPEVTFSDDITFHDGHETIMAFHVHTAHTDGDAMVYFLKNNVLHMGDTYFAGRYPYIDLKSGGTVNGYIEAQRKALLVINDDTRIIPGHGRPSNKKELEVSVAMLEEIKKMVQKEIDAGRSLEEVKKNTELTKKYDSKYGQNFINPERMREIFYTSLTNND
ncbi:MBL fold metallo-hydrolase [Maribacter algicola]|uniref:MBL fold metallo-hydrolase n=1 Tax=Meishania litoralis TaxID=3434685 RepID=A0ACC7LHC4_9FLAO